MKVEAAVFGAPLVVQCGDPVFARAARDLIAKVATGRPRDPVNEASLKAKAANANR